MFLVSPFSSVRSELRTFNPQVVGSNPTGGTNKKPIKLLDKHPFSNMQC